MPVSLVVGASGAIGRFLLPRLVDAGHEVIASSRAQRSTQNASVRWVVGDLGASMPTLPALDIVFSCGPLDAFAHWFAAATTAVPQRVIAFGSMSIDSKSGSTDTAERALVQRLHEAEQRLIEAARARGCEYTILRPTLIYGAATDHSLTPLAHLARRWRVFPRISAARGLRQPVHADDLAAACVALVATRSGHGRTYALGGGERLAFATMLERVRASLPFRSVPLPLSLSVLRACAQLAHLSGLPRISPAALDRLRVDLVADDRAAAQDFGWAPRAFHPDAACWFAAPQRDPPFSADG
jgi:nucleoside-diphosphate-sugar epimerase